MPNLSNIFFLFLLYFWYLYFYWFQDHWISALQTLELSLEEVVHIRWASRSVTDHRQILAIPRSYLLFRVLFRSVLSRAELDALPLDNNLKDDVERGKVIRVY